MESIEHLLDSARNLCQQGKVDEGKRIYLKLNATEPHNFRVLANLGAIELNEKNFNESIQYFREAIELNSLQPIIHYNLGRALHELKIYSEAMTHYQTAIELNPNFSEAYLNYGLTLSIQENYILALEQYKKAIEIKPDYADAYCNSGVALNAIGRHEDALLAYQKATLFDPNNAETYYNSGVTLHQLSRYDEALESYNNAIQLNPNHAKAYSNRGLTFNALSQGNKAISDYQNAIKLNHNNAEIYNNLGVSNYHLRNYEEAIANYHKAINMRSNYAEAFSNRGLCFNDQGKYEAALVEYQKAIKLKPEYTPTYNNLGLTLYRLGRYDEALTQYDQAIELAPDQALAYWNKSLVKLLHGDYKEGWKLYERRWEKDGFEEKCHNDITLWTGEQDLKNKTLLIWSEQGQGDIIQFSRYILLAKSRGAKVTLEVPNQLVSLLSSIDIDTQVIKEGASSSTQFDFQIPLMSLPFAFKTEKETIPSNIPYIHADDEKVHGWQKKLGVKSKPRIGLVWSGSTIHKNDSNRSLPLEALSAIMELQIEFHSLQVEYRDTDWNFLIESSNVIDHQSDLKDFSDTAALIQCLDLIISVDTSVAHLAGALGKPIWVLLPYSPDFRWMLNRNDSPWYPTAKLFRQEKADKWDTVINTIKNELIKNLIN